MEELISKAPNSADDTGVEESGFAAPNRLTRTLTVTIVTVVAVAWVGLLVTVLQRPQVFDDSMMFYRYALNMRNGLGVSWNLDGIHTYGETAPLWGLVILLASYLPLTVGTVLKTSSWVFGGAAMWAVSWAVANNARSAYMRRTWRVLPMVALPLGLSPILMHNAVTGMETMLGVLLAAVFVGLMIATQEKKGSPELAGLSGVLLFTVRPEMVIAMLTMPILMAAIVPGHAAKRAIRVVVVLVAGISLDLLAAKLYFHTALPLSFYMKGLHAIQGYRHSWMQIESMLQMFQILPYLLVIALLARKDDWRLVAACFLPVLCVFAYLLTVTQVMGYYGRYYVPYLPFFLVPSLLILDRRLVESEQRTSSPFSQAELKRRGPIAAMLIVLLVAALLIPGRFLEIADRHLDGSRFAYDPVKLDYPAQALTLQTTGTDATTEFLVTVAPQLPKGATIASTEVGWLGVAAPGVNIIDLAGLNDTDIALNGFSVESLLSRKPDIIWFPHRDYTYQRGLMMSDASLLKEYDLYADAAIYGVAIRKNSPFHDTIERELRDYWAREYLGSTLDDHLVKSATWTGKKHLLPEA